MIVLLDPSTQQRLSCAMNLFTPRLTELVEAAGDYLDRFLRRTPDGRFSDYIKENRVHKGFVGIIAAVVWGVQLLFSGVVYAPSAWSDGFLLGDLLRRDTSLIYQIPICLFAAFSVFSLWSVYNNYVVIIHPRVINWLTRWAAFFAMAFSTAALVSSLLIGNHFYILVLLAASYLLGMIFSGSFASALQKYKDIFAAPLAHTAAIQWFFVNAAVFLLLALLIGIINPGAVDEFSVSLTENLAQMWRFITLCAPQVAPPAGADAKVCECLRPRR